MTNPWLSGTAHDRAYQELPDRMYQGPVMDAFQAALGAEIDEFWTALAEIEREMLPETAISWGLDLWEQTLTLAADSIFVPNPNGTVAVRRAAIIGQLTSHTQTQPFGAFAAGIVGQPVTVLVSPGIWLVVKFSLAGWPGDVPFAAWETRLQNHVGPIGAYLAPWDTANGLTVAQVDQMHTIAVDQLTITEVDGLPIGEQWLHLDAEGLAWSAVDALGLSWAAWDRRHA